MRLRFTLLPVLCITLVACGGRDAAEEAQVQAAGSVDPERAATSSIALALASRDTIVRAAAETLSAGHPWHATVLLAPVNGGARSTPLSMLLAARAASAWNGWDEVERLLRGVTWLDSLAGGEGRELLARSALARGVDTAAVRHAATAASAASDQRTLGIRSVLLARALERTDQRDSARAVYARSVELLPAARDWLLLRAAGLTDEQGARARLLSAVRDTVARERVGWTDALARERAGDLEGSARAYDSLDARASALRLRLTAARRGGDPAQLQAARGALVELIRTRGGTADARSAVEALDAAFDTLTPAEELVIARSVARSGPLARAVRGFRRGLAAGGTAQDRFTFGDVLMRTGENAEAARVFASLGNDATFGARAAYQRARALIRAGSGAAGRAALRDVAERHRAAPAAAAPALLLLGDLYTDDGRDTESRRVLRELVSRYPSSAQAPPARFHAAMIALIQRDSRTAARELDSLVALHPRSGEATAAQYWSGRAHAAAGNQAAAAARWRTVVESQPISYYAVLARRRLSLSPWTPADSGVVPAAPERLPGVVRRAALLDTLGMDVEERFEWDAAARAAEESPAAMLATAEAMRDAGRASRGISLALKAVAGGARDARAYRLAYPVVHREVLTEEAQRRKLDPALVSALIRQESSFNPRAISPAGARGLTQVMPTVGRQLARSLRFPVWDPALLLEPDANLAMGTAHLAGDLARYSHLARALAAYNAGGSRVTRWIRKPGTDDPEVFAERIPYVETRDYVRIVQRNREIYRVLYEWK